MPLNCAGHYWKAITPTAKVFYEIPVESNGEKNNIPELNDYNVEKKRRSSNVENMDINSFSQFSSPSTSVTSPQKEPLFKKNQNRVSHVNGGEPSNQTGFESLLNPTSIPSYTASLPKKKKHMGTSLPRETAQSKKEFIKLQDKVKQNQKNISNTKKQRAHMNPVRNTQSPHLTSTKNKDRKQPTFLKGSNTIQECEVPKARVKKPSEKVQQLTEKKLSGKVQQLTEISSESPKRKPKTVSNAISVKQQQRSTENSKKGNTKSMTPPSSVETDSYTIKMQPINNSSKKEICSKKKPEKVPNPSSCRKKNEVSEQKKRSPKKYKRINPIESSDDESNMELSIKLRPKRLKPIDSETESDEVNTQICMNENAPVHEVEPVLPEVVTLSVQEITNWCSALKELERSEPISSSEVDSEKNISQPVPSEIDSVVIVKEVPCKKNKSTSCNPVKKQISKNPYKNLEVPFQDEYHQPAFFTDILQHVKGSVANVTNVCMPSTSGIESNEIVVDLDTSLENVEIIDVTSSDEHEEEEEDDDDVVFLGERMSGGISKL